MVEENDEGRSRRHSGSSIREGYGGVSSTSPENVEKSHTFGTADNIGDACDIRRSCTCRRLNCGVLCVRCPRTRQGADIAFDTEGHISVVAAAIL